MKKNNDLLYIYGPLFLLCCLAFCIQINLYLHKDVALIAHAATQMMAGQTYASHIFDPNPPMIFYLNYLPIFISKMTHIKIIYIFRGYVLWLIFISIGLTYGLIKKIFEHSILLRYVLVYGVAYVLLFLPAEAFGQREHFLLTLTIPYIFLAACRLSKKKIPSQQVIVIGMLAGIGFALKPFFLPTLFLIELLFIYREKNIFAWVRSEFIIIACMILTYALSIFVFYPTYFKIIVPFWLPYYHGIIKPWSTVLLTPSFIWCCGAFVLACRTKKQDLYAGLKQVLAACILGNMVAYLIPQVAWYYHILPALAFSFLYFVLFLSEWFSTAQGASKTFLEKGFITFSMLAIFFIPCMQSILGTLHAMDYYHTKNAEHQLIRFLNSNSAHNNYMFLSMTHNLYALEFYSTAHYVGSFSNCNWEYMRLGHYSEKYQKKWMAFVMRILTEDLNHQKPQFIIVDTPSSTLYLKQFINYPEEYYAYPTFKKAWSSYAYLFHLEPYDIYGRVK